MVRTVDIGKVKIGGNNDIVLIAGPCVIESEKSIVEHAKDIKKICKKLDVGYIFKSSYDKANRSSLSSYRGPGIEKGLDILKKIKKDFKLPVLSDVHCRDDIKKAKKVLDVIQIPAFLCRQTDFLIEAGKSGKVINVKKGQFLAPWDMINVIEKIESTKNRNIILTERGVMFGYNNLVTDLRSLEIMRGFGYPVVFDATHSVQLPGGNLSSSGGENRFVPGLSRAAVAMGCDGIFLEVHKKPSKAFCDGPNMINLTNLEKLLKELKKIKDALR